MQVFVNRLSGEIQCVTLFENETAGSLMSRLNCGKLFSGMRMMNADDVICNNTLFETAGLEGGKNKKSKKKDTSKPKHKCHHNKKEKLACLKHYNVKGGKVERLRKACTNKKCGAACFLAQHKDRLTCGKCHTHVKKE